VKKLILIFLFIIGSAVYAQEETLMGQEEIANGGFGAPVVKFTSINSQFGVLAGGRGGWIINHSLILGIGGYGLVNNVNAADMIIDRGPFLNFGYGGFEMEYIRNWDKMVHASIYLLLGGGAVSQRTNIFAEPLVWTTSNFGPFNSTNFFIAEPAVNIELNIVKFFRIDIGASYRLISGVNRIGLNNSDFGSPSFVIPLKFGKF